jgi:hypothetical protein
MRILYFLFVPAPFCATSPPLLLLLLLPQVSKLKRIAALQRDKLDEARRTIAALEARLEVAGGAPPPGAFLIARVELALSSSSPAAAGAGPLDWCAVCIPHPPTLAAAAAAAADGGAAASSSSAATAAATAAAAAAAASSTMPPYTVVWRPSDVVGGAACGSGGLPPPLPTAAEVAALVRGAVCACVLCGMLMCPNCARACVHGELASCTVCAVRLRLRMR